MGIRIISDPAATSDGAAMYDSVSGWAFGPVFADREEAERFLEWAPTQTNVDLRAMPAEGLEQLFADFRASEERRAETVGRPRPDFDPHVDYPERYMNEGVWQV